MNCREYKEIRYQLLDGELDTKAKADAQAHIKGCPFCQFEFEQEKHLDGIVRSHLSREEAPYELRESVVNTLEHMRHPWWEFLLHHPFRRLALSGLLVAVIIFTVLLRDRQTFPIYAEAVSNHLEYLKGSTPMEIASDDLDEVLNWFSGKMDFMVKVPDLRKEGFRLVGARLSHVKDRKAAYIVFERDGHFVSAFVMDTSELRLPKAKKIEEQEHIHYAKSQLGYNSVLCLTKDRVGPSCLYVTDLSISELNQYI